MSERTPEEAVRLDKANGVATLTIDYPPVNPLAAAVTTGIARRLDEAEADDDVRAIVITGAGGNFVAGADITRLQELAAGVDAETAAKTPSALVALLERFESGSKPTVAAIDGFALGGGLELAMACNARVGAPKCRVGLPELSLGLMPGAGGTQRLPRLAGLAKACEMMLSSKPAKAAVALEVGIVDELVDSADKLVGRAREVAREIADGKRPRRKAIEQSDKIPSPDEAKKIVEAARAGAAKKARNVEYPDVCLDAVLEGALHGAEAGMAKELEGFVGLVRTDVAAGMIHVFFAERAASKVPGVTDQGLKPRPIDKVGIIGGGTMGSGIATALVKSGIGVVMKEVDAAMLDKGIGRVRKNLDRDVKKGRATEEQAKQTLSRVEGTTSFDGFDQVGLVIEAATEKAELKQKIFAELAKATSKDCILATNTSTIDIEVVGKGADIAERLLGTHFFSPATVMPLVEVIRTDKTSKQALVDTLALVKKVRKTPVTVGNCTGFLVNRVFMPYGQIMGFLIDHGVDPYQLDQALFDFGMPMGPCRMGDLAGVDVSLFAGSIMDQAYPDRAYRSPLRKLLVEAGRLGEKTGVGHYKYVEGKAEQDPDLAPIVEAARKEAGSPGPIDVTTEDLVRMPLFGVVNEACRALDEGVAIRPSDVDVACIMGYGFPAYRGGPMKWADTISAKVVHDSLTRWRETHGCPAFTPSDYLARKARAGEPLSR